MHLKLQKSLESKKVTEKGEYYFAKGFKHVVSCAKKNCSDLVISDLNRRRFFIFSYKSRMPLNNYAFCQKQQGSLW